MEMKSNIGYEQLLAIIKQLPIDEVNKLKSEIESISSEKNGINVDDLKSFIANGPVMGNKKYQSLKGIEKTLADGERVNFIGHINFD